jgi:hypothetical protein
MNASAIRAWLIGKRASSAFVDICKELLASVPPNVLIASDVWDILPWLTRPRHYQKFLLDFSRIRGPDLRLIAKLWILHGRLTRRTGCGSAKAKVAAVEALSYVVGSRASCIPKSDDFKRAERWLTIRYGTGTTYRRAAYLQQLARWLTTTFNWRLNYRNALANPVVHGRYGTEQGRDDKLIPTEVLRDLVAANLRSDLSAKDEIFLSALTINIAAGFRISEMVTMPADCLLKENGALSLLYYPEKGGRPVPRLIHPRMTTAVEAAAKKVIAATNKGRELAKQLCGKSSLDWSRVVKDRHAFRYFTAHWAHEWTSRREHALINPDGAWCNAERRFIDVVGALKAAGGNKSKAARQLGIDRIRLSWLIDDQRAAQQGRLPLARGGGVRAAKARSSWDTDARVLSILQLERHSSVALNPKARRIVRDVIDEAHTLQLKGNVYPAPAINNTLERLYRHQGRPIIRDSSGKAVLGIDEALFVIQKYALSEQRATKTQCFSTLTDGHLSRWLAGEARSRGTGNHEDSVFSRLGIVDPRSGEIARFTWHDIRHWLNTVYENGGLTDDHIALIFGRRDRSHNPTYDQTSNKVRIERLRQGIRDSLCVGRAAESYHRLAEFSREDAETYLAAATRMINPMPHGACTLDWSRAPCPHHLGCLTCESERPGPCEHLVVEPTDSAQVQEIRRLNKVARLSIERLTEQGESPQIEHFRRLRRNTGIVLKQVSCVKGCDGA